MIRCCVGPLGPTPSIPTTQHGTVAGTAPTPAIPRCWNPGAANVSAFAATTTTTGDAMTPHRQRLETPLTYPVTALAGRALRPLPRCGLFRLHGSVDVAVDHVRADALNHAISGQGRP